MSAVQNMDNSVENVTQDLAVASPKRGRKPLTLSMAEATRDMQLVEQAATPMVEEIRQSAVTLHKGEFAQSLHMAQGQGMFQALDYIQKFSGIARLKWLAERKQYGDYKGVSVTDGEGTVRPLNTFEDLCDYVGQSRGKINEDLQNLALMGEEILQAQEALGLGYRELRKLRAGLKELSADEQQALLEKVKTADDKEEVLIALEEMGVANAKLRKDVKELQSTVQAKDEIAKAKNVKIDDLTVALQKATSIVPEERKEQQDKCNVDFCTLLDTRCTELLGTVLALTNVASGIFQHEDSTDDTCAYVHKRISLLCSDIAKAFLDAGVDVDLRAEFSPVYPEDSFEESSAKAPDTIELQA